MSKHSLVSGRPGHRVEALSRSRRTRSPTTIQKSDDDKKLNGDKRVRNFPDREGDILRPGHGWSGTCGYVALGCASEWFVWLKDAWRANYEKEGDILAALNSSSL